MASVELSKADREAKAQIKIGNYILKETLGVGTFGKVKGLFLLFFYFSLFLEKRLKFRKPDFCFIFLLIPELFLIPTIFY